MALQITSWPQLTSHKECPGSCRLSSRASCGLGNRTPIPWGVFELRLVTRGLQHPRRVLQVPCSTSPCPVCLRVSMAVDICPQRCPGLAASLLSLGSQLLLQPCCQVE